MLQLVPFFAFPLLDAAPAAATEPGFGFPRYEAPYRQDDAEAQEVDPTKSVWKAAVTLGASSASGNTDVKSIAFTGDAVKEAAEKAGGQQRYTLGLSYNYAEAEGVQTQNRKAINGQVDHFLSARSYVLGTAGAMTDDQANLDLRWTAGVGYGNQFVDSAKWKVSGELGISYVDEDYEEFPGLPSSDQAFTAARIAYNWDWIANDNVNLTQNMAAYPNVEDPNDFFGTLDTRAKIVLTEKLFTQLRWLWNYNSNPPLDSTGVRLERSDHLVELTIGWTF